MRVVWLQIYERSAGTGRIGCSSGDIVLIALLCIILLNCHMYVGQSHMGVSVMVGSQVNIRVNSLDEPSNTRDL
jgi:hypothetical protein